jgi:hypothetical protein
LRAVADGAPERVELAEELVAIVLGDALVSQALALEDLLRKQSPLALVRAVQLAERIVSRAPDAGVVRSDRNGGNRAP